uniref:Chromobox protein homolog 3 n=1 Tax=Schistocephalus solidus TaxID=70667 RepID=A0A0X3NTY8_SCHSO
MVSSSARKSVHVVKSGNYKRLPGEYEVEKILDVKVVDGSEQFLVKWKDHDEFVFGRSLLLVLITRGNPLVTWPVREFFMNFSFKGPWRKKKSSMWRLTATNHTGSNVALRQHALLALQRLTRSSIS